MRNPAKQSSTHSSVFAAAVVVGTIASLYFMREILIPLAFALTFAFLLTPVVSMLEKLRIGRVPAVILTLSFSLAAAGWAGWTIGGQLVDVINQLPTYRENIHAKIQAVSLSQKGPLGRAAASVKELGQELSSPPPPPTAPAVTRQSQKRNAPLAAALPVAVRMFEPSENGLTYLRDVSASFLRPIALVGIIIIFTIFMLVKREDLRNRLLRLVGLSQLNVMTQALDDAAKRVSRYLLMQFLVNAGFGLTIGIGLHFIGVPTPALWGVVGGLLRIIPYVGTLVAAGMPLVLSLAVFNGWDAPLLVFALFAVVEILVGNFLEPWLYGTHTGISSLALLVSTVFWTILWGPSGLVLSTPLTVCVVVLGRYVPELSFLHVLLGDEPVLSAEAHLYQRLLAMDQQEARTVVDVFLRDKPLIELYDAVLMPALNMAEQDRHMGAIDSTREEFLFLSINEMVAEFAEYRPAELPAEAEGSAAIQPHTRRILCLSAHDEADEIAAAMLAQVLEQDGYGVIAFPLGASLHETVGELDPGSTDVVCISALPPYAFAPARTMCKRLRAQFPNLTTFVCVWGFTGDTEKAKARFERAQPQQLVTSLSQALELIHKLDEAPPRQPETSPPPGYDAKPEEIEDAGALGLSVV
jgi:predicted PurR-regulated permease PerM